MEEILASIRRIIADDDATKTAKPAAPPPPPPPPPPVAAKPAPPPPPPPPKPAPAPVNKQEDIDAMLADVDVAPPPNPAPKPAMPDVLDLTEAMTAVPPPPPPPAPPPPSAFRTIDAASDVVFTERAAVPAPAPPPAASQPLSPALLSNTTTAAVDNAFNLLASTVLGNNARTLEDLVKEMLRPMLKSWLDDNLPTMVDRIVRAEIERVSRGR